ncbi:MAG: heme o synthase [Planctomycetales bacterium]|nr:heme o synthase [Planctomycetales bacterium]
MTSETMTVEDVRTSEPSRVRDYVALTKPRISVMVLATVAAAGYLAAMVGPVSPWDVLHACLGTLLIAASGSALNQAIERWLDARMSRTSNRPLPSNRLSLNEVVTFGTICFCVGTVYLWTTLGTLSAALGVGTWVLYVWIYTPMKTRTWTNTIVGAVAGAMPVLIGWYATGAPTHAWIVSVFLLLFLWQFPHFMAIAWLYRKEYAEGGMKMLPVVDPSGYWSGIEAVVTAVALVPVVAIPAWLLDGPVRWVYLVIALVLTGLYLSASWRFLLERSETTARRLLRVSLLHLPFTLLAMILATLFSYSLPS